MLVMDAIERVEVAIRTQLAYHFAHTYGPFGHTDPANLPRLRTEEHKRWIEELKQETDRSKETFIEHFRNRYGESHDSLPLWMLVEVMSFGKTLTFFRGVHHDMRRKVVQHYQLPDEVLESWLRMLNAVRNICAHHGRLWNRELGYKPKLPNERKYPDWHRPVVIPQDRVFVVLTALRYLLRYAAPTSHWEDRLRLLLQNNKEIPLRPMGFPENWNESPLWKQNTN